MYACSPVISIGACTPGMTPDVDVNPGSPVAAVDMTCNRQQVLQAVYAEDVGRTSFRYRYFCCAVTGLPISVLPDMNCGDPNCGVDRESFGPAEGIYCPVSRDMSGRFTFDKILPFKSASSKKQTLYYDRDFVSWKISESSLSINSDAAHPLDAEGGANFQVTELSDFDGVFEGGMPKEKGPVGNRVKPKLIALEAIRPTYREECKDD